MRFYRPQSFFTLLLTGFVFVSLPLLVALLSSIQILDRLMEESAVAVFRSVDRVSTSRRIIQLLQDQERKARLYNVLGEPIHLQGVNATATEIQEALGHLVEMNKDEQLSHSIKRLKALDNYIVASLNSTTGGAEQQKKIQEEALEKYSELGRLAVFIEQLTNELMIAEVEGLKQKVRQDKETLVWQTSGLLGFSILLVILFVLLISKPVRQIDKGIERLGDGDFKTAIVVSGPKDLEMLGKKLDWLRKRLAALDREKVKLIAHISHELKTPLASIKEGAGLLKDELAGPMNSRQKEVVAILDKNCNKLQKLIENILNFNMAQVKREPVEFGSVQLDALIDEVVVDHKNSILARKIELDVRLAPTKMTGNRKQLKTIFDNLLSNAVKFTPDGGIIKIHLRNDGTNAFCIVEDSGPGIDEGDRSQIFSPFFQGKEAKKAVVKGSGLGLAICKEYVQNHGGTIRLQTSRKGARFAVTLPLISRVES